MIVGHTKNYVVDIFFVKEIQIYLTFRSFLSGCWCADASHVTRTTKFAEGSHGGHSIVGTIQQYEFVIGIGRGWDQNFK